MAVKMIHQFAKAYQGWSTDTKPEHPEEGSIFHCVDTGEEYVFYDGMWEQDMRRIHAARVAESL